MKGIIGNITFPFLFQTVESNKQKTFFSIFLAVFFNSCYTSRTSIFSSFSLFMPPDMETSFKSKTKHVPQAYRKKKKIKIHFLKKVKIATSFYFYFYTSLIIFSISFHENYYQFQQNESFPTRVAYFHHKGFLLSKSRYGHSTFKALSFLLYLIHQHEP